MVAVTAKPYIPFTTTTISDPHAYAQFKQRRLAADFDYVYVEAGAHPNVLGEAKYYWNASNHIIDFRDVDYKFNYITLEPKDLKVKAVFQDGFNLTIGLPNNFVYYSVAFSLNVFVTANDIDAILQWHNAKHLEIHDECDVAYDLLQRIDDMKMMRELEVLKLDMQRYSMDKMSLKPFVEKLPHLKRIDFKIRSAPQAEIAAFLKQQELPKNFEIVDRPEGMISIVRKG